MQENTTYDAPDGRCCLALRRPDISIYIQKDRKTKDIPSFCHTDLFFMKHKKGRRSCPIERLPQFLVQPRYKKNIFYDQPQR